MPIVEDPFERIALDVAEPLPKSTKGNQFVLVIIDYATTYLDAIPLRTVNAPNS